MYARRLKQQKSSWLEAAKEFVQLYFRRSGVHGFAYLGRSWLTLLERFIWFVLVTTCIFFCIKIGLKSVHHFYTKSTVVGLERDYYSWNTTLPALTVCPLQRLDTSLVDEYCRLHNIVGQSKQQFSIFLEQLANATYTNLANFPTLSTIDATLAQLELEPKHYMQLIYNLSINSLLDKHEENRVRCFDGNYQIKVQHILTEYGLCYMANSYLSDEYSATYFIFGHLPQHDYNNTKKRNNVQGTIFNRDVRLSLVGFKTLAIDVNFFLP